MRLIDADVFVHNVVKYSHQSTKTIGQALADTPTVDAIPKSVIDKIRAEIEKQYGDCAICEYFEDFDYEENDISEYRAVGNISDILQIIDKHLEGIDLGDYPDAIPNQFDNMTGSMNL